MNLKTALRIQKDADSYWNYVGNLDLLAGRELDYYMTFQEIGDVFGVSGTRIRQIFERAIMKLQHPSNMNILKEYFD